MVGNPVCGDLMQIQIKVEDGILTDVKFKTFGCGAAIATSSMVTDLAIGKTIEEALKITRSDVAENLEGLPPVKMHCSNLAADALHAAIKDYVKKEGRGEWFDGKTKGTKTELFLILTKQAIYFSNHASGARRTDGLSKHQVTV